MKRLFFWVCRAVPGAVVFLALIAGCQNDTHRFEREPTQTLLFLAPTVGPAREMRTINISSSGASENVVRSDRWRDLSPDVGPDGRLVFMSNRHERSGVDLEKHRAHFRIFTRLPGEPKPRPVTDAPVSAVEPRLSPNGDWVAYRLAGEQRTVLQVYHWRSETRRNLVAARDILDIDWSPDGERLAVAMFEPGHSRLAIIQRNTGEVQEVVKPDTQGAVITGVSWSPDGRYLGYIINRPDNTRPLYLYDLRGQTHRRISSADHHVQQPLQWRDDGKALLYASLVDFEFSYDEKVRQQVYRGSMHIFITPINGASRQITQGSGRHGSPLFTPDEQRIVFLYAEQLNARRLSLRSMNLEGKDERQLYERVAPESTLQWMPETFQ